jgi:hypothetical protein
VREVEKDGNKIKEKKIEYGDERTAEQREVNKTEKTKKDLHLLLHSPECAWLAGTSCFSCRGYRNQMRFQSIRFDLIPCDAVYVYLSIQSLCAEPVTHTRSI